MENDPSVRMTPRALEFDPMRGRLTIRICLLILQLAVSFQVGARTQSNEYGPEVRSFLDLMRHEEDELEFQIKHNEISRREYLRSKAQIAIHRQTVLDLVKETGQDYVPELHVVAASELDQLIEDGTSAIKGIKRGGIIAKKWRYIGSVHRVETFYIFERLTAK
jgi:hypothetical protein